MSRVRLAKIIPPAAPPTGTCELYYDSATSKLSAQDEAGNIARLAGFASGGDYRLVRIVTLPTGTGSYTPTLGVRALYVECIGGGSAGGGAATSSASLSLGSGGAAGGYSAVWLTGAAVKTTYTVAVGAGGTGVAGAAGNNGADTTFDVPSVCTGKAGTGGITIAAGTTATGTVGGAGSPGIGDITIPGGGGFQALRISATAGMSGAGGSSFFGGGARGRCDQNLNNGLNADVPGGGGGGAITTSTQFAGGNGANGLIRVWEFA
jgi:hypothetical protein